MTRGGEKENEGSKRKLFLLIASLSKIFLYFVVPMVVYWVIEGFLLITALSLKILITVQKGIECRGSPGCNLATLC